MNTIEACVIVPLFFWMSVWMVITAVECHDECVIRAEDSKMTMHVEFHGQKKGDYDKEELKTYAQESNKLLQEMVLRADSAEALVTLTEGVLYMKGSYGSTGKNNPVDYARAFDAAKHLLEEKE